MRRCVYVVIGLCWSWMVVFAQLPEGSDPPSQQDQQQHPVVSEDSLSSQSQSEQEFYSRSPLESPKSESSGDAMEDMAKAESVSGADVSLDTYWIDWDRSLLHLMITQKSDGSYSTLVEQAWQEGMQWYLKLARWLYYLHYKDMSLSKMDILQRVIFWQDSLSAPVASSGMMGSGAVSSGETGDVSLFEEAKQASQRASRYVFSTLSEYYSDGKVRVRLSSRLAPVFARLHTSHLLKSPVLVEKKEVSRLLVRFLCPISPRPSLTIRSEGEVIYAPHLVAQDVYREKLMGTWLLKKNVSKLTDSPPLGELAMASEDISMFYGSPLSLDVRCTDHPAIFDLDRPELWKHMPEGLRQWLVSSASVAFIYE
ncbi:MAG: hypothetical protein OXC44_06870 [Proteobacteria bacterium]|nr:hypothetical protein [Pseudomonadota bacterium]